MSKYAFDTDLFIAQMLPPRKRTTGIKAWMGAMLSAISYLHELFFENYSDGSSAAAYNNGTAYTSGEQVKYTDNAIYECILASTGNAPTNTTYWRKLQDSFIGVRERAKYSANVRTLEYALNKWFGTTFAMPPSIPDIYIEPLTIDVNYFVSSTSASESGGAAISGGYAEQFVGTSYTYNAYAFNIAVPVGLAASLGITQTVLENKIRAFADKIILSGTNYTISTY